MNSSSILKRGADTQGKTGDKHGDRGLTEAEPQAERPRLAPRTCGGLPAHSPGSALPWGSPAVLWASLSAAQPSSHSEHHRKTLSLPAGPGERNHSEAPQDALLSARPAPSRVCVTGAPPGAHPQGLTDLGEGTQPATAGPGLPPGKWEKPSPRALEPSCPA